MVLRSRWIAPSLPFWVLAYLYIWLVIEPSLLYHAFGTWVFNATVFSTASSFLRESLATPGGAVCYAGGFLSQAYYHSWLGALVLVGVGACLCSLSGRHLAHAGYPRTKVLAGLPAIALFLMVSRYKQPMAAGLTVVLGLILSLSLERLALRGLTRIAVYCVAAAVAFWLGGAGGVLVLSLMALAYAVAVRRDWVLAGLAVPAAALIVWVMAEVLFGIGPRQAFLVLAPWSNRLTAGLGTFSCSLQYLLYLFLPVTLAMAGLGTAMLGRMRGPSKGSARRSIARHGRTLDSQDRPAWQAAKTLAPAAVWIAALGLALALTHGRMDKALMRSNAWCRQGQWDRIVDLAGRLPEGASNVYFTHALNRALYHTGRLPYEMFRFPQERTALLLTHEDEESSLTELDLCDAFMELGELNTAERLASELLVNQGNLGTVLDRLARIHLVKGDLDTARVYLKSLEQDLIYRSKARALLKGLDQGFGPDQAASLSQLRSVMRTDAASIGKAVDLRLTELLARNPANKMAFEYLMACYLLTGRLDQMASHIDWLGRFGYPDVPTHYEEAMLLYYGLQGQSLDLSKLPVRRATIDRYMEFVRITNSMAKTGLQAGLGLLSPDLRKSYFFYYTFQCLPKDRMPQH